jgi:hypothetical protein
MVLHSIAIVLIEVNTGGGVKPPPPVLKLKPLPLLTPAQMSIGVPVEDERQARPRLDPPP